MSQLSGNFWSFSPILKNNATWKNIEEMARTTQKLESWGRKNKEKFALGDNFFVVALWDKYLQSFKKLRTKLRFKVGRGGGEIFSFFNNALGKISHSWNYWRNFFLLQCVILFSTFFFFRYRRFILKNYLHFVCMLCFMCQKCTQFMIPSCFCIWKHKKRFLNWGRREN